MRVSPTVLTSPPPGDGGSRGASCHAFRAAGFVDHALPKNIDIDRSRVHAHRVMRVVEYVECRRRNRFRCNVDACEVHACAALFTIRRRVITNCAQECSDAWISGVCAVCHASAKCDRVIVRKRCMHVSDAQKKSAHIQCALSGEDHPDITRAGAFPLATSILQPASLPAGQRITEPASAVKGPLSGKTANPGERTSGNPPICLISWLSMVACHQKQTMLRQFW